MRKRARSRSRTPPSWRPRPSFARPVALGRRNSPRRGDLASARCDGGRDQDVVLQSVTVQGDEVGKLEQILELVGKALWKAHVKEEFDIEIQPTQSFQLNSQQVI